MSHSSAEVIWAELHQRGHCVWPRSISDWCVIRGTDLKAQGLSRHVTAAWGCLSAARRKNAGGVDMWIILCPVGSWLWPRGDGGGVRWGRWVTYSIHLVKILLLFFLLFMFSFVSTSLCRATTSEQDYANSSFVFLQDETFVRTRWGFSGVTVHHPFQSYDDGSEMAANFPHSLSDKAIRRASISDSDRILEDKHTSSRVNDQSRFCRPYTHMVMLRTHSTMQAPTLILSWF